MKSKKETVYDFIKQSTDSGKPLEGVSTQYLARRLEMQRSNVSSILNELVKEGAIEKTDGRPVLYRIPSVSAAGTEKSCFSELIGNAGSLKGAVQLAKAAILDVYKRQVQRRRLPGSGRHPALDGLRRHGNAVGGPYCRCAFSDSYNYSCLTRI